MKKLILLVAAVAGTSAFAATPIDETVDANGIDRLEVTNLIGSVTIVGTNRDEVSISGSLSDDAERFDVSRESNRILVQVIYPNDFGGRRRNREETVLEIEAPESMTVDVDTISARISVDAMEGEQELSSISGSIESTRAESEIRAETVSGSITLHGQGSNMRAEAVSVSGRIELEGITGEIASQNVSGSISLESSSLSRAELQNVSGRITVDANLTENGRLRAMTTSGRISMQLNDSPPGHYQISSFSGSIDNCFGPEPTRPQFGPPSSTLNFDEPEAETQVYANSMSGSIELCR